MASHPQIDAELWQRVRHDDRSAYESLYRRYMRVLYAAIYKWTNNRGDAEDILQDVFLDIWEKRQQITIQQGVFAYFYTITRYKVFDHFKEKKLSERQLKAWDQIPENTITNTAFALEPLDVADSLIDAEIAQLPPQMKRVYLLRFREDKSIQEIADAMLVSPNTIKNHLQKIRKRLHACTLRLSSFLFSCLAWFIQGH